MTRRSIWQAALTAVLLAGTAGAAHAQGGGGGRGGFGFGGGRGGPMPSIFLLNMPEVQKELKLDDAQIGLIQGMAQDRGQRPNFQDFQSLSPDERQKRMDQFRADMQKRTQEQDKQVADILNAKQNARLKELKVRQAGARALNQKEIQDALKLSADQRQKIADAGKTEQDQMAPIFASFRPGADQQPPSDEQRQQTFQKMQTIRTETDAKLITVLTDPQKKQFETMKGAPFTFPPFQFGRRGGRPGNQ